MSDQLELMVKYLVQLQFYSEEEDVLYSRDKKDKISIEGIKSVILAFEKEFQQHIHMIRRKEYRAFLNAVSKRLPFDIEQVLVKFNENVREIGAHNLTDELSANFLIGPIRSYLQTKEFEECMYKIKQEAIRRRKAPNAKDFVNQQITELYSRSDKTVSILYNLALLNFITSLYGSKETKERVKWLLDRYTEELIDILSRG